MRRLRDYNHQCLFLRRRLPVSCLQLRKEQFYGGVTIAARLALPLLELFGRDVRQRPGHLSNERRRHEGDVILVIPLRELLKAVAAVWVNTISGDGEAQ